MSRIKSVKKLTDNKHLNLYQLNGVNKKNGKVEYFVASRKKESELAIYGESKPDAVSIYAIHGEDKDRIVLVRQFRYPIDGFIYELPAGLIDKGETPEMAASREFKEETGLDLNIVPVNPIFTKPCFSSVGMSDESSCMIYGSSSGNVSYDGLEDTEDLQVVLADKQEVIRILQEEKVAVKCMLMLQKFLTSSKENVLNFNI